VTAVTALLVIDMLMRDWRGTQRKMVRGLIIVMLYGWLVLPGCGRDEFPISAKEASVLPTMPDISDRGKVRESYGKLPLSFEANEGQFDSRVKFVSRGGGHTVFLTSTEAVLSLYAPVKSARDREADAISTDSWDARAEREAAGRSVLRMKLIGAAHPREIGGIDELPGSSNYFIGDDSTRWRTGIKCYSKVRYRLVYPGIDLIFHSEQRKLEYDFRVAPGANPRTIRLAFEGAKRVRIEKNGDLVFDTGTGEVRQHKPIAYQDVRGSRRLIAARYVMRRNRQVGFEIGRYDRQRLLVIDPVLHYSTYLGGGGLDTANSVAVDANGYAYVVGRTTSTNFPIANGFQGAIAGTSDVFITKLNPAGDALVYSTYLGGGGQDSGFGLALDTEGNAYITGETSSINFPTKAPVQEGLAGSIDAFVTKLNSEGSTLVYSSYLGGGLDDSARAIAVDSAGAAHIAGNTGSPDFPLGRILIFHMP
jgi:beta-propeller repeat-containing protein